MIPLLPRWGDRIYNALITTTYKILIEHLLLLFSLLSPFRRKSYNWEDSFLYTYCPSKPYYSEHQECVLPVRATYIPEVDNSKPFSKLTQDIIEDLKGKKIVKNNVYS